MTLELRPYELRLVSPMVTSYRSIASRRGVLVSFGSHGSIGWGDACPMEGWSRSSIDDVSRRLAVAAAQLDQSLQSLSGDLATVDNAAQSSRHR